MIRVDCLLSKFATFTTFLMRTIIKKGVLRDNERGNQEIY